jgi:type II secretory pathway pseudopilin PulG
LVLVVLVIFVSLVAAAVGRLSNGSRRRVSARPISVP